MTSALRGFHEIASGRTHGEAQTASSRTCSSHAQARRRVSPSRFPRDRQGISAQFIVDCTPWNEDDATCYPRTGGPSSIPGSPTPTGDLTEGSSFGHPLPVVPLMLSFAPSVDAGISWGLTRSSQPSGPPGLHPAEYDRIEGAVFLRPRVAFAAPIGCSRGKLLSLARTQRYRCGSQRPADRSSLKQDVLPGLSTFHVAVLTSAEKIRTSKVRVFRLSARSGENRYMGARADHCGFRFCASRVEPARAAGPEIPRSRATRRRLDPHQVFGPAAHSPISLAVTPAGVPFAGDVEDIPSRSSIGYPFMEQNTGELSSILGCQ